MTTSARSITQEICAIIADKALMRPEDITPQTELATLVLDSLAMVELIFALEERFDISVPFNANAPQESGFDLRSVGSIVAAVEGLLAQKAA